MRLDLRLISRRSPLRLAALDRAGDGGQRTGDEVTDLFGERQQPWSHALQDGQRVGQIAGSVRRRVDGFVRGARQQRCQVVGQDLGRDVDHQRVLAEPGDRLQVKAVFQAFERFLDTPALVVQTAEAMRRGLRGGEVGHQHPRLAVWRGLSDHADAGCLRRALPVGGVAGGRCAEGDVGLGRAALDEPTQGLPAAAAGVAAHDEADAALLEQIDEPGRGVAAIEQQHIAGAELVQGVGEHRTLGFGGGADLGVQREFGTRQVQREQTLIGIRQTSGARASADGRHQHRGVGSHQTKTLPARQKPGSFGTSQKVVVQRGDRWHVQVRARLGEGSVADATHRQRIGAQGAEDAVQERLLGGAAHAQQRRHQRGQRQCAAAGEGAWVAGMTRKLREGVRTQGSRPVLQKGLNKFTGLSSYCEMNSENVSISNTYDQFSGCLGLKFAPLSPEGGAEHLRGWFPIKRDPINNTTHGRV